MFIVIEGGDATGKTTVCNFLEQYLTHAGFDFVSTREPGGTPMGEYLREAWVNPNYTMDGMTELLLVSAVRRQHIQETIKPALAEGKVVLCSRFVHSTLAHREAAGVDTDDITDVVEMSTEGFRPDLTILLDLPVEIARARMHLRGEPDRIEQKGDDYHRKVREIYLEYARDNPEEVQVIDAKQSLPNMAADVLRAVVTALNERTDHTVLGATPA